MVWGYLDCTLTTVHAYSLAQDFTQGLAEARAVLFLSGLCFAEVDVCSHVFSDVQRSNCFPHGMA